LTSHRIRKHSQKIEKTLSQGKKEINLQESNRGGSLSRMDRTMDVMCADEQCYRVTSHSMNMTECLNRRRQRGGGAHQQSHGRRHQTQTGLDSMRREVTKTPPRKQS